MYYHYHFVLHVLLPSRGKRVCVRKQKILFNLTPPLINFILNGLFDCSIKDKNKQHVHYYRKNTKTNR